LLSGRWIIKVRSIKEPHMTWQKHGMHRWYYGSDNGFGTHSQVFATIQRDLSNVWDCYVVSFPRIMELYDELSSLELAQAYVEAIYAMDK